MTRSIRLPPRAMNVTNALERFLHWLPLWFGLGFLAPLIAQAMQAMQWQPPIQMPPMLFGLLLGGTLGLVATLRGRWL